MKIAMNSSTKLCSRSRGARIAASSGFGLLAAAFVPATALAVGEPIEIRIAYLDPGTGSLIIQAVVAVLAGAAVAITSYWQKIKTFFGRNSRNSESSDTAPRDE
jgi:hypothetical protein